MDFEQVRDIIANTLNCDADSITMDTKLVDDLEADSLDIVELQMALEDAGAEKIPDEKLPELKTVGDIVNYLKSVQA